MDSETVDLEMPKEFVCPLSESRMADPVILSTGISYERTQIVKYLADEKNLVCPASGRKIENRDLRPNIALRDLIVRWCINNGLAPPDIAEEVTASEAKEFMDLLGKIQSGAAEARRCISTLRHLLDSKNAIPSLFGEHTHAIGMLIKADFDTDLINVISCVSEHGDAATLKVLTSDPDVPSLLLRGLRSDSLQMNTVALRSIFNLSKVPSYKEVMGKSGALQLLIGFVKRESSLFTSACRTIKRLCKSNKENEQRLLELDGTTHLINKLSSKPNLILPILVQFETDQAHKRMAELEAVGIILSLLKDNNSEDGTLKIMCLCLLHRFLFGERSKKEDIVREEQESGLFSRLARDDGDNAVQEIAKTILFIMKKYLRRP